MNWWLVKLFNLYIHWTKLYKKSTRYYVKFISENFPEYWFKVIVFLYYTVSYTVIIVYTALSVIIHYLLTIIITFKRIYFNKYEQNEGRINNSQNNVNAPIFVNSRGKFAFKEVNYFKITVPGKYHPVRIVVKNILIANISVLWELYYYWKNIDLSIEYIANRYKILLEKNPYMFIEFTLDNNQMLLVVDFTKQVYKFYDLKRSVHTKEKPILFDTIHFNIKF